MAKVEDNTESDGSSDNDFLFSNVGSSSSKPSSGPILVKEENLPSSASDRLKSYFVGMGFSSVLVDKVIEENGVDDENLLLESLINRSKSEPEASDSSDGFSSFENKDDPAVVLSSDDESEIKQELGGPSSEADKKSYLSTMDFSEKEIDLAIARLGENAPLLELVDFIFASQIAKEINGSADCGNGNNKDLWNDANATSENPIGLRYPDHSTKFLKRPHPVTDAWISEASSSNTALYEDVKTAKKAKYISSINHMQQVRQHELAKEQLVKEEIHDLRAPNFHVNIIGGQLGPPYIFYGNVIDVSEGTWTKLSEFLYRMEPEFVNSQFFSALIRKEGYLHNLPTDGRFFIVPKSPMSIEAALPYTKSWWPAWDTRKQLSYINSETTGLVLLCEQLGRTMRESKGLISKEQVVNILHQCRQLNLVWVGHHKLRPMEPEEVETILGYPKHHTEFWGFQTDDRLRALKYCFQTDTIGYHLSVLKGMYPDGLRVLSIYSGIGGAEIALQRLGIRLKCVVSVEASEINRKILKRWWQNTGQSGVLKQIGEIEKVTSHTLESLVNQFGGFDVIIGSNTGDSLRGSVRNASVDMDMNPYFEFVRVFQRIRSIMGRTS